MDLNVIRGFIFLVGGLFVILFSDWLLRVQGKLIGMLGVKYKDSKRGLIILGIVFLIVASVLFWVSLS